MIAAWRRGKTVDSFVVPAFMTLGAFPAFFIALLGLYFLGLKLDWFPIQHAYDNDLTPGFSWAFLSSAFRHAAAADARDPRRLHRRLGAEHADGDDQHDRRGLRRRWRIAKGLKDRRVMTSYAGRNAILPPLNGFAAQFATAVGGVVFIEFVFSYPGAGLTLQQAVLGNDYPLAQALLRRALGVRDRRELHHGHPQLRPRPAGADELMRSSMTSSSRLARGCSLRNPKSRIGLGIIAAFMS